MSGLGCHCTPLFPGSVHSFQTGMPIFRVLLSAVMAAGSLASFNPSLPPANWLAEGMPHRRTPLPNPDYTTTTTPPILLFQKVEWGGRRGAWVVVGKVKPQYGSCYREPEGQGFRWRTKHKMMIMMMCGYFWGSVSGLSVQRPFPSCHCVWQARAEEMWISQRKTSLTFCLGTQKSKVFSIRKYNICLIKL